MKILSFGYVNVFIRQVESTGVKRPSLLKQDALVQWLGFESRQRFKRMVILTSLNRQRTSLS